MAIKPFKTIPAGCHWLVEFSGCPGALLDDADLVQQAIRDACAAGNLTVLNVAAHAFQPQGVTALALLSESHLSIHTWPEAGYAAIDVFSCGMNCTPETAIDVLAERLRPTAVEVQSVERGPGKQAST